MKVQSKPRILAMNEFYLPGYKGGGSIRALVNVVGHLKKDFEFVVVAGEHDLNEAVPYSEQERQAVIAAEGYDIRYFPRGFARVAQFWRLLHEPWDLLYLNGAFSSGYSILPLLLRRLLGGPKPPLVLAPRGEFMDGALRSTPAKYFKKRVFLTCARLVGHFSGITFHATSAEEVEGIRALGLGERAIVLAPDLPPLGGTEVPLGAPKEPGRLRMVFLSRLDPKKNLHFAIEVLRGVKAPVQLDIVGPVANADYWATCEQAIRTLPAHIQVRALGAIPHARILQVFSEYDLFFFPTQAENNGYVILEALLAGCPALLSDRTPWLGLEALGAGLDLPLGDPAPFRAAIENLAAMGPEAHAIMRNKAQEYGRQRLSALVDVAATRALFAGVLEHASRRP